MVKTNQKTQTKTAREQVKELKDAKPISPGKAFLLQLNEKRKTNMPKKEPKPQTQTPPEPTPKTLPEPPPETQIQTPPNTTTEQAPETPSEPTPEEAV